MNETYRDLSLQFTELSLAHDRSIRNEGVLSHPRELKGRKENTERLGRQMAEIRRRMNELTKK